MENNLNVQTNPLIQPPAQNPLIGYMRQPKIYIKLPSQGMYWPNGSLAFSETGEYPVYSMTAKDELMLKIPDALMNGQAVVDVIQNCMPNIKNAWNVPSTDIDIILIAIRLATYGEKMTTPITFAGDIEMDYQVDLRTVMDNLTTSIAWDPVVPINKNMTIFVRPLNYKQITESALQSFETQKLMQVANNESLSEDDKVKLFKESFTKLTNSTVGAISQSVYKVDTAQGTTDNPEFIKDFMENADKDIFNQVQEHLETLRIQNSIKPIIVAVTDEMREKGITGDTLEVPISFDPSTFFV
jgi:hypothetical protein